jgi:hypothetical protein
MLSSTEVSHELKGFLLEVYTYFVSVVNITANTDFDYRTVIFEPKTQILEAFRDSSTHGAMIGCAHDLFELMPAICKLGYKRIQEEREGEFSFETIATYKSLESKIQDWQPSLPERNLDGNLITAAKMYQQTVLIFLHSSFYGSKVSDPAFISLIDTSMEILLQLSNPIESDSHILSTLLWPIMIMGSCLRDYNAWSDLRSRMLDTPYQMELISKSVQILDWLWEEDHTSVFGPYGLGVVMKKHHVTHCMA